jgi:hypothetical protein
LVEDGRVSEFALTPGLLTFRLNEIDKKRSEEKNSDDLLNLLDARLFWSNVAFILSQ